MSFEYGPTIRINELDEATARAVFGSAFYDAWKWSLKVYGKTDKGSYRVADVDRENGVITVTADD